MNIIKMLASQEKREFFEKAQKRGEVLWDFWPLHRNRLDALVRISKGDVARGRKGSNRRLFEELERAGFVEVRRKNGLPFEFDDSDINILDRLNPSTEVVPTKAGYNMLERFAPTEACFPADYERQFRASPITLSEPTSNAEATDSAELRDRFKARAYRANYRRPSKFG